MLINFINMKSINMNSLKKKVVTAIFAILILSSMDASAKKVRFLTSQIVPAAVGYAKITRDENKNYVIKINLTNLAESKKLQPSKQIYVVWMLTDDQITKNIGQLKSSPVLFSKKLKATLLTATPFRPVKIFITAEDDGSIQFPGMQMVLSTDKF